MRTVIVLIPVFFILLLIPSNVSAFIPTNIPDTPDQIDWVIFFVTSKDDCSSRNKQALSFYATLTDQYLSKFKTKHKVWASECISKDVMSEVVNLTTKKFDLVIIIPDSLMSIKDRHTTSSKGHYANWEVHTIVSQALTLYTESRTTGWTLSHELAHFIVAWNDYSWSIVENSVHNIQGEYNKCYDADTTLTHCSYLWETIKTPSGKYFPVMSSEYLNKVVNSMKAPEPTPVPKYVPPTTPKYEPKYAPPSSGVSTSDFLIEQSKFNDLKKQLSNRVNDKIYSYERLGFTDPQAKKIIDNVLFELRSVDPDSLDSNKYKFQKMWNDCKCQQAIDGMSMTNGFLESALTKVNSMYQDVNDARNIQAKADINAQKKADDLQAKIDQSERDKKKQMAQQQHQEYLKKKADKEKQDYLNSVILVQQQKYQEHEKLQSGVDEAYESLKGITGKTKLEQQKIDNAWDLVKDSKTKLLTLKQDYKKGDDILYKGSGYVGQAHSQYLMHQLYPTEIGRSLVAVSTLIEDVKTNQVYADESKPQTCFLTWCW